MPQERLEGIVERITFYNAENGYSVVRVRPNKLRQGQLGKDELATVIGTLPELQPGESVRFSGAWMSHSDYGSQFRADAVEQMAPATLEGLRHYLGSGLIKGVGVVTAWKIVDYFRMQTLEILDDAPELRGMVHVRVTRADLPADPQATWEHGSRGYQGIQGYFGKDRIRLDEAD